jgi:hypothetical protein
MKRVICIVVLALGAALPALAQEKPQVLILGVYHMANPGHDLFNSKADDVLAPKRQAEIADVIAALKKFNATKIAIESDPGGERPKGYAEYLAGKHELTRNEIEQLGYRLARELGHKTIYPVDADGEFPWPRLVGYAKASGRSKELEAITSDIGEMVKAENAHLASHTILETLLYMNADAKVAEDVGFYYREAHLGEPWDWAGGDLLADWYRRNIRIFTNIVHIIDSPTDRVLVIYGAGHLGWLRNDVASDPGLRLRKLAEFVR